MTRITKARARKMFNNGETITIVPHKVRLNNVWGIGMTLQEDKISNLIHNQTYKTQGFDWAVDRYTVYNCNFENGYYVAYYIED